MLDGIIAQDRAHQGEIIVLSEDELMLCRLALPRAGWWRKAQRYRPPTRLLTQSQITAMRAAHAQRGCGCSRASVLRPATCWRQSMAGSPWAMTLPTCRRLRRYPQSCHDLAPHPRAHAQRALTVMNFDTSGSYGDAEHDAGVVTTTSSCPAQRIGPRRHHQKGDDLAAVIHRTMAIALLPFHLSAGLL
jgi:hypothetical protein